MDLIAPRSCADPLDLQTFVDQFPEIKKYVQRAIDKLLNLAAEREALKKRQMPETPEPPPEKPKVEEEQEEEEFESEEDQESEEDSDEDESGQ